MDESNDEPQGNAKRLKIDMEDTVSITATNSSSLNKDTMSSSNAAQQNTLQLVEYIPRSVWVDNQMTLTNSNSVKSSEMVDNEKRTLELLKSDNINDASEMRADAMDQSIADEDVEDHNSDIVISDPESAEIAGPSVVRLAHIARNYRRRIIIDSSSDDEELQAIRTTEPSVRLPRSTVSENIRVIEDANDTLSYSPGSPTFSSGSSASSASASDWVIEDSDSTFDSNDRIRFEPNEEIDGMVESILQKKKPKYTWFSVPSIMYRQNGFSVGKQRRHIADTPYSFQAGVRGSLHGVERLELMGKLSEHFGCINCLNFNQNGKLLASGSDDLKIKIWNWARKKAVATIQTSHVSNIFQAKFIDSNNYDDCIELVSSDQSGSVRHYIVSPCGAVRSEALLCESPGAVHKLGLPSNRPYEVLSAGEDTRVMLMDLREGTAIKLLRSKCQLYSIACHPLDSNEFCVGGQDQFVRVYDRRSVKSTLREHCPEHLKHRQDQLRSVTSAVYNYVGSEILASYSNENIYLFDSSNDKPGEYLHRYCGHRNNRTIKGVNFYGPRSEFVISGSENPGHVFFWEKQTEAIVQMIVADIGGVVNCLEPHPYVPVLATSGLADEIRLWHPSKVEDPTLVDLKKFVHRNMNIQMNRHDRHTGLDIFQFILQRMRRRAEEQFENRGGHHQDEGSASSTQNDSSDEEDVAGVDDDDYQLNPCNAS